MNWKHLLAWRDFIRSHTEVLAAADFFTAEVWTVGGLMTYCVLTFTRIVSRKVNTVKKVATNWRQTVRVLGCYVDWPNRRTPLSCAPPLLSSSSVVGSHQPVRICKFKQDMRFLQKVVKYYLRVTSDVCYGLRVR
jgi:hypothetical protein